MGIIETVRNKLLEFVLQIEAEAPDADEAAAGQAPLPQEIVTQIFNNYISGDVTHIAGTGSSDIANSVYVGSMKDSQIQQAGERSSQNLSFSRGSRERTDVERLMREISAHIDELGLVDNAKKKAEAQVATIEAQLTDDEPDAGIITQAGKTLRNITEGAVAGLIAAALQPGIWHWVGQMMFTLFPQ